MPLSEKRIAELLTPFLEGASLSEHQLQQVSTYLDLLLRWNSKINLTAVREPEEIIERHFGEAFFAGNRIFADRLPASAIDLGSGAGFPGLPLAILKPELKLTLLEANQKKAAFLREAARFLDLKNISVVAERAEQVNLKAELVTLRAVERFEQALPIAYRLLAEGGRLALLIGSSQLQSAKSFSSNMEWAEAIPMPNAGNRILLVGSRL